MSFMSFRQTTLERAYALAESGECNTVSDIKSRLKAEGYADIAGQLYGPTIQRDLRTRCAEAQRKAS